MMLEKCILKAAVQSSVFIAFYLFSRKCSSLKGVGFLVAFLIPVNQFLGVYKNKCPVCCPGER